MFIKIATQKASPNSVTSACSVAKVYLSVIKLHGAKTILAILLSRYRKIERSSIALGGSFLLSSKKQSRRVSYDDVAL
jgi:hypothetical protein